MTYQDSRFEKIIGKTIDSVELNKSADLVTFRFNDGFEKRFSVDGDCCSHSWIEHLELPNDIKGAVLTGVDESAPITQDHEEHDDENGGDCISVYNTVFHTNRGDIVLEYRNSSNGYYGGSLVDA